MSRTRMVVDSATADEIGRMLVRGFTQRHIAKTLDLPRCVVSRVALGEQVTRQPSREDEFGSLGGRDGFGLWSVRTDMQRPMRCPTCGGKVYIPCRLCLLRKQIGEKS